MSDTSIRIKDSDGVVHAVDTHLLASGDERQVFILGDGENPGLVSPATEPTLSAGLGADGATPPVITGTGIRGWLRAIYEKLVSGLTVTVSNPTTAPETGLTKDATLSTGLGVAGFSPPSLPGSGTGLLGYLRAIRDLLAGTLTVNGSGVTQPVSATALPLPTGAATETTVAAAKTDLDSISTATGAASDTGNTVIGRLKAIASSLATSASSFLSVRLTDGTSYLSSTAGRLQVADGGIALKVDGSAVTQPVAPTGAGDVATALTDGRKTVAVPGTAEAIRASLTCKWVQVTALKTNGQQVNVGGAGALATAGASTGTPLDAGQSTTIPVSNANLVFVDARVAGEGVSFTVGA